MEINQYAWNQKVSMVYIEQPCGVGFSYSDNEDDYKSNDAQAANDNYALIQAFMIRYPQFAKNKLYLTSESYGGHYIPTSPADRDIYRGFIANVCQARGTCDKWST